MTEKEFKGKYFDLIGDAYRFMLKHKAPTLNDEYWEQLSKEADELYAKHEKTAFSKELIVAILLEIERIAKGV
jgi:hypothetical protein